MAHLRQATSMRDRVVTVPGEPTQSSCLRGTLVAAFLSISSPEHFVSEKIESRGGEVSV